MCIVIAIEVTIISVAFEVPSLILQYLPIKRLYVFRKISCLECDYFGADSRRVFWRY